MPKYTPSEDEMDESYGAPAVKPPAGAERPAAKPSVDEENAGASEILIQKSQLPEGCKVGDSYTFRVVKDYGDEVSLVLQSKAGEETAETEEPESVEAGELATLAEEGA